MTHYQVYLETSAEALEEGGYLAHVPALIGCVARGKTKEEALDRLGENISAFLVLMRKNGVDVPPEGEPLDLEVIETESTIFPPDYAPLLSEELDPLFHQIALSRQTLLRTLQAMPDEALNWHPGGDETAWGIPNVLAHMAQAELWYASRLDRDTRSNLLWRLAAARTLAAHRLQELHPDERGKVTVHGGEEWTPRKVARRMIEHEQEHLQQIKEMLQRYEQEKQGQTV